MGGPPLLKLPYFRQCNLSASSYNASSSQILTILVHSMELYNMHAKPSVCHTSKWGFGIESRQILLVLVCWPVISVQSILFLQSKKKNLFFSSKRKDSRVPCYYVQFFYNLIKYSLKSFDAFFVWWGNIGKKSWKIYITKDFFFFFEGKGE